jgi:hypothetical protein
MNDVSPARIELTLRLEGARVQIVFDAFSHEDEVRLRQWLGHARIGERIERALADALAQLERRRAA